MRTQKHHWRRCLGWIGTAGMLQVSGCSFDTDAFWSGVFAGIYDDVTSTFIVSLLSDLLNVSPTFSF